MRIYLHRFLLGLIISTSILYIFIIFFNDSFFSFFSQDDFFHFRVIMDKKFTDIPSFFLTLNRDYAFYRPLSRETLNLILYKSFGLNSIVFHFINILIIFINGFLLFVFVRNISSNSKVGVFSLIIYSFNSIHSIELYYLSSVQTLLVTTFILGSLIFYIKFLKKYSLKYKLLSILFFIAAVLSHEFGLILFFFLPTLEIYNKKKLKDIKFNKILLNLFPFIVIFLVRLILQLGIPVDSQTAYKPVFSLWSLLNTFLWYLLWINGLPEMLSDFMTLKLNFNPHFFEYYGYYAGIVFPLLIINFTLIIFFILKIKHLIFRRKDFFLFLLFFITSIIILSFFPRHKFIYYLSFALIGFCGVMGLILYFAWKRGIMYKLLTLIFLLGYIFVSFETIKLNKITYWAAKRANSAKKIVKSIKKEYPEVQKGTVFYIKNDPNYPFIAKEWGSSSKQAFYILSGSDAFKLIYNDPSIKVYFEDNDKVSLTANKDIIVYVARFPY